MLYPDLFGFVKKRSRYEISLLDCKTVGFFSQNQFSVALEFLLSLALRFQPPPDLLFDCSRVLEYGKIRTVLQSTRLLTPGW